jgi:hypothetical protein
MSKRIFNIGAALLACASLLSAGSPGDNSVQVSLTAPLQIPETLLAPGKYTFTLEDRLPDRAIVRVTEPSGAQHYLLTVPSSQLARTKGLIYFSAATEPHSLEGWQCPGCIRPLEFVYPKDEAVKLTASTGKPILAFDPTYDKLPDNLSPEDRRVVTLWLLAPKRVTADGRGEGLTAAKYATSPKMLARNSEPMPQKMPKTAGNLYVKLCIGSLLLMAGGFIQLLRRRRQLPAGHRQIFILTALVASLGVVTGFAVPLATRNDPQPFPRTDSTVITDPNVTFVEVPAADNSKDDEVAALKARNRRLEALVAALRSRRK